MIRVGSMCSGYGGLELAVAAALSPLQVSTAWHAEVDPPAVATLGKHWPGTPNLGDLLAVDWARVEPVDLLALGVPCQAVSAAGRQQVELDPRWLWPAALIGLRALRPPAFVFENVRNLTSIRDGEVWAGILADMRAAGYAVRWLTLGACAVGAPHHRHRVFAAGMYVGADAPTAVRVAVDECGARRGVLLASPLARDGAGRNEGDAAYWERKRARGFKGGIPLGAQINLLATPTVADSRGGRSVDSRTDRSIAKKALQIQVLDLLPTPKAQDARNGHSYRNNRGEPGGLASTTLLDIAERWGKYAAAVARWEEARGAAAPEPTEVGPRGGRRLAAALPEWMMGLEAGWLTGHLERGDALRLAGNGVCPQQGAHAVEVLLTP